MKKIFFLGGLLLISVVANYVNAQTPSNIKTDAPVATTIQSFCTSATLSNLEVEGSNIKWYTQPAGGSPLNLSTPFENGKTYYASQTINGIESNNRIGIRVIIPDFNIVADKNNIYSGENVNLSVELGDNAIEYTIGSIGPAGGFVFYDKGNNNEGWQFIEVNPIDIAYNGGIGCYCEEIEGTSNEIGTGMTNTQRWWDSGCDSYWLMLADIYKFNNYSDWFIPSKDELKEIYTNLKLNGYGNLNDTAYWSSTPASYGSCGINGGAWVQSFKSGDVFPDYRSGYEGAGALRLVRYFSNGLDNIKYFWSTGETTPSINVNPESTTNYWVDVTINGVTCRRNIKITVEKLQIPSNIPIDGLVAWYPFNGNANDESGNGYDGVVNNAQLSKDRFGNDNSAYSFTTDQDIVVPNTDSLNLYPLTISLWYNIDSIQVGENANIFSKYYPAQWNGYIIHLIRNEEGIYTYPWYIRNSSNRILGLYGEELFYQSDVQTNKWYNFTFVVDESGGKFYVNGILVDSHDWTGTSGPVSNDNLFKIGGQYNNWYHGKVDDIAIWNRALSSDEILSLFDNTQNTYLEITCPSDTTVSCIEDVPPHFQNINELTDAGGNINNDCIIDSTSFTVFEQYSAESCPQFITRIYEIADTCGNTVSCTQEIIVHDLIPPIIESLPDIKVTCENEIPLPYTSLEEFINAGGSVTDNCGVERIEWVEDIAQMIYPITSITRTYSVVDSCGNSELYYQNISINDSIPPTFTVPADAYISKDENCEYNTSVEITGNVEDAFDNCSNFIEVNYEDELVTDTLGREVINRTWSAIDGFGNINNEVQKIYIEDSTPPVIHCPPDVLVETEIDIPEPFSSLNDFALHGGLYEDNCEIIDSSFSLFYEFKDTLVSPIELKRTYIIADADGNESVCLQKFKIEDITSLDELNASNNFQFVIYPNPNKGVFTLNINGVIGNAIVEIFTSHGKFVERKLLYPLRNSITQEFNLSKLDRGIYSIRVTDEQKSTSQQFIIR